jgi:hypothetical protein
MSKENVQKFTRLRQMVEDWEEIYKQYPAVKKMAEECARARNAMQMISDALAQDVY